MHETRPKGEASANKLRGATMFADVYASAQFAASITLLMVALLYVVRAYDVARGQIIVRQPTLLWALSAHMLAIAAKQWVWTMRGVLVATGADPRLLTDSTPMIALALNLIIVMTGVAIYMIVAAHEGRRVIVTASVCVVLLAVTSILVGRYEP